MTSNAINYEYYNNIGGIMTERDRFKAIDNVYKLNIAGKILEEHSKMNFKRAYHSICHYYRDKSHEYIFAIGGC